jgi:CBS domain containing-hemolysin-like protein
MAVDILMTLALVLANGFFVATEFAVARLRPTQVDELERQGKAGASSARHAVDHIDAYLAACQLGITLASIGLGVVGKPVFEELLEPLLGEAASVAGFGVAAATAFFIVTLLHVVIGELAPKSLAIARAGPTALKVAPVMRAFYLATKPAVDLFNWMGNLLLKPFGVPPASESGHAPHSETELRELLRQSRTEGLIDPQDQEFAENVFAFGDRRTREIMTPRREVYYLTTEDSLSEAVAKVAETGHTRLPLCEPEGGLDVICGVVHAKDLIGPMVAGERRDLKDLVRPLGRVSDATLIAELLRELRRSHQHMTLVVDEHGTAVGVVTLEDIIEELVGEIEDEFDPEGVVEIERDGDSVLLAGSTPIRMLEEELGVMLEDAHEATIGGHVVELIGRLPAVGEQIVVGGHRLEVCEVDDARIVKLRLEPVATQS